MREEEELIKRARASREETEQLREESDLVGDDGDEAGDTDESD
jgi:hypothetical protein